MDRPTARHTRLLITATITVMKVLAWMDLVHLSRQMSAAAADATLMAAMGMAMNTPWTWPDLWLTFAMWSVMMVGMMAPSVTPMLLLAANAPRDARGRVPPAIGFGVGYLVVWIGFSAVATLAQWGLHEAALLSPAMAASSPRLGGVILIGAGLYQLTPLKHACLTHCRSPIDFLMTHWRGGATGSVRTGLHHGWYCLGCCWALMAVLFAVGIMNLAWVAALAVLVLVEKLAPAAGLVSRSAGAALVVAGIVRFMSIA